MIVTCVYIYIETLELQREALVVSFPDIHQIMDRGNFYSMVSYSLNYKSYRLSKYHLYKLIYATSISYAS